MSPSGPRWGHDRRIWVDGRPVWVRWPAGTSTAAVLGEALRVLDGDDTGCPGDDPGPVWVDGRPADPSAPADLVLVPEAALDRRPPPTGAHILVGGGLAAGRVLPAGEGVGGVGAGAGGGIAAPGDPPGRWRGDGPPVRKLRGPLTVLPTGGAGTVPDPHPEPEVVTVPPPPSPAPPPQVPWASVVVPATMGLTLAVLWGPLGALVALGGPAYLIGSRLEHRVRHRLAVRRWLGRLRRDAPRIHERRRAAAALAHRRHPPPDELVVAVCGHGRGVWSRTADDGPEVTVGVRPCPGVVCPDGRPPPPGAVAAIGPGPGDLTVPVVVRLRPGLTVVTGPPDARRAVLRWITAQLLTWYDPDRLGVRTPAGWRWASGIGGRGSPAVFVHDGRPPPDADGAAVVVSATAHPPTVAAASTLIAVDAAGRLAVRTADGPAGAGHDVGPGTVGALPGDGRLRATGLDPAAAELVGRALRRRARLRGAAVADAPPTAADLRAAWSAPDRGPRWVLDTPDAGPLTVDLVADGPHMLVAGTTGSGKSELLRTMVADLCSLLGPGDLSLILVDFKGGAAFDAVSGLPQVAAVITDLDGAAVARALRGLAGELADRERLLRRHGVPDLGDLPGGERPPRIVVVVDEFAALATVHPELLEGLVDLGRRGRSLGIHLVLATQRPAGVLSDHLRANTALRLCLRVEDPADAVDVVGVTDPAHLPGSEPGWVVVRRSDGPVTLARSRRLSTVVPAAVQAWRDGAPPPPPGGPTVLEALTTAAAAAAGPHRAAPPWRPALPSAAELDLDRLPPGASGVAEGADARTGGPWRWEDGHLLVVGDRSADPGAALGAVIASRARAPDPPVIHAVVGAAAPVWIPDLGALATCVAVSDVDHLDRLVSHLDRAGTDPGRLLAVWGLGDLARALGERPGLAARFERLLAGPGVTVAAAAAEPGEVPARWWGRFPHRLIGHLGDPAAAAWAGADPRRVATLGRGRFTDPGDGSVVQLVTPDAAPACGPPAGPGVPALPSRVAWLTLAAAAGAPGGTRAVPVGVGGGDMRVLTLAVGPGEGALVTGGPRSGRSTALMTVAAAAGVAGRPTLVVCPARSPLARRFPVAGPAEIDGADPDTLLVVDDPHRLTGALTDAVGAAVDGGRTVVVSWPTGVPVPFGHWVRRVAADRRGLALMPGPADSEVWGPELRVLHPPARPGAGVLFSDAEPVVVQVGLPPPTAGGTGERAA